MAEIKINKNKIISIKFFFDNEVREEKTPLTCCGDGTSKCKCISCVAAKAMAAKIDSDILNGEFDYKATFPNTTYVAYNKIEINENIAFKDYASLWLESNSFQPSSLKSYKTQIRKINERFANIKIKDIIPTNVKIYKKTIEKYSPKYQKHILATFSQIMEAAKNDRLIADNPIKFVPKPKVKTKTVDPILIDDVQKILTYSKVHSPKLTLFYALGFYTGMRDGEILAVKWLDFNFNNNYLRIQRTMTAGKLKESTKTAPYRDIPIPSILNSYIEDHKKINYDSDNLDKFLFVTKDDKPYTTCHNITRLYWKINLDYNKIDYRNLYQMRHSFACNAIIAGFPLAYVQLMLGHANTEMIIKVYGNYLPKKTENILGFQEDMVKNLIQYNNSENNKQKD